MNNKTTFAVTDMQIFDGFLAAWIEWEKLPKKYRISLIKELSADTYSWGDEEVLYSTVLIIPYNMTSNAVNYDDAFLYMSDYSIDMTDTIIEEINKYIRREHTPLEKSFKPIGYKSDKLVDISICSYDIDVNNI